MKISIVTTTWNSAETLRDTIDSVLRQEYEDYEYIIIDGGSQDATMDIVRSYEPRFGGRMRWVSEPDKGIYDAMNKGIAMATGEVVGLLNSDDFFAAPDVLKIIARTLTLFPDADAVYGDVSYVKWNDTSQRVRYYSSRHFCRSAMRMGFMPAHPSFYCRKATYERFKLDGTRIPGFRGDPSRAYFNTTYRIAADFECLLRMIFVGRIRTIYLHKECVIMRRGGASSSGLSSHRQINRDHRRAFRENGVYSNIFLISLRYAYKVMELAWGRLRL